jgi:hypothetical protein
MPKPVWLGPVSTSEEEVENADRMHQLRNDVFAPFLERRHSVEAATSTASTTPVVDVSTEATVDGGIFSDIFEFVIDVLSNM